MCASSCQPVARLEIMWAFMYWHHVQVCGVVVSTASPLSQHATDDDN